MSKVAAYLRQHILGEVASHAKELAPYTHDSGIMEVTPEMVVYPRVASDIRKVARFSWQLAEKGHILPITVRGAGRSTTGSSLGRGVVVATQRYMDQIFEYDAKQRMVRLHPGVTVGALQAALGLHGSGIPALGGLDAEATVGGAVSSGWNGPFASTYGDISEWVSQLEIVLASGDVIQTQRISKRELGRRKGLQTMEGELYRSVDNLIDDNTALIESIDSSRFDGTGYPQLAQVRRKDGSFDLTPLFIGSDGTLGIITEMILQTDFVSFHESFVVLGFEAKTAARDATPVLRKSGAASVEYFDGELFAAAVEKGRSYEWFDNTAAPAAVVIVRFDDMNTKVRAKKIQKLEKVLKDTAGVHSTSAHEDDVQIDKIKAAESALRTVFAPEPRGGQWPELLSGFYVPENRLEEFTGALGELATKQRVELPLYGSMLSGVYSTRCLLHLGRVGDRQKVFKLLDEFAALLEQHGGHMAGRTSEGRLQASFAHKHLDTETDKLYTSLREIFDAHGILNPGVKQPTDMRELAKLIVSE